MLSSSSPSVGFEQISPVSGEDAEELSEYFKKIDWMLLAKQSGDKLKHFDARMLGLLMLAKLSEHSQAHGLLTVLLTDEYCDKWDRWQGADTPAATEVKPLYVRLRAMVECHAHL